MNVIPTPAAAGNPPPLPAPAQTSVLAVLSLVFGILGCTFIGAVAGLVCGLVAKARISKSGGRLKGDGLALAGIIISGVMLLLTPFILAGMLLPALGTAKAKAQTIASGNNLKQLALAARLYSNDHGDKFPPATHWFESLRPSLAPAAEKILRRPADNAGSDCGYGYNLAVAGKAEESVNLKTVLFFELQTPRGDVAGGADLLRRPKNARDRVVVGFADGSVQQVRGDELKRLRWQP